MFILIPKLKTLKQELQLWNKQFFGDVHKKVNEALETVKTIQEHISTSDFSESLYEQELKAQMELQQVLNDQETYWKEKSRVNWHCFGDRNTSFFHKLANIRQTSKQMAVLKHDGKVFDQQEDLERIVMSYITDIYAT